MTSGQGIAGVALVTGANRGIGRQVARQLAERGYEVVLSARDGDKARAAAQDVARATGASVRALTLDVADANSIKQAAAQLRRDPGRLDVLVNNAGVGTDWGVSGTSPDFEAIARALDTNFYGAYRLAVAVSTCSARARIRGSSTCPAAWAASSARRRPSRTARRGSCGSRRCPMADRPGGSFAMARRSRSKALLRRRFLLEHAVATRGGAVW